MSSAPDSKDRLSQAIGTTPFNSNGTIGRVLTFEVPKGPMVRRRPGICGERYEQAQADFESKPWYVRWTAGHGRPVGAQPTDELMYAKQFREECEKWPDEIPQSMIDDKRQQLTDHVTGKSPLPPEQSLKLRRDLDFLSDVYTPGPRASAAISSQEQAWLDERNLRFGNTLAIGFLGPIFGAPGAATRMLGGTEQQVSAANDFGAAVLDAATIHTGFGGKRSVQPLAKPGEHVRGAPLEPVSRPVEGKPRETTARTPRSTPSAGDGTVVARRAPTAEERARRVEELAKDPAQGNKATAKTRREAEVGLSLEEQGKLPGPITRDPTGAAEFVDATGQKWDVKGWNSQYAPVGYNTPDALAKIRGEVMTGENVIVDTLRMTPQHVNDLRSAVDGAGLGNNVIFH